MKQSFCTCVKQFTIKWVYLLRCCPTGDCQHRPFSQEANKKRIDRTMEVIFCKCDGVRVLEIQGKSIEFQHSVAIFEHLCSYNVII